MVTKSALTKAKMAPVRIYKKKMKIFILCFQTKKNLIEKTQRRGNDSILKSGQNRQKSSKIDHFTLGGPRVGKKGDFAVFF